MEGSVSRMANLRKRADEVSGLARLKLCLGVKTVAFNRGSSRKI